MFILAEGGGGGTELTDGERAPGRGVRSGTGEGEGFP